MAKPSSLRTLFAVGAILPAQAALAQDKAHVASSPAEKILDAFSSNPMLYVWLVVGVAACYFIGWFVLRVLLLASEMPRDAGCMGCLGGLVAFGLFILAIVVMILPIAEWIIWLILIVLFLLIVVALVTKGRTRLGPLILLFLLLFLGFYAWKAFGPKPAEPTTEPPKTPVKNAPGPDKNAPGPDKNAPGKTPAGQSSAVKGGDIERMKSAVVRIETSTSVGTGFFIDDHGTILTCNHCVGDNGEVKVTLHNTETLQAKVVAKDPTNDLALCTTVGASPDFFDFEKPETVKSGEDVQTLGYPLDIKESNNAEQIEPTVSGALVIGAIRPVGLQISGAVNHGNSGGPLFDKASGKVVGVVRAKNQQEFVEEIALAVPLTRIEQFLNRQKKA